MFTTLEFHPSDEQLKFLVMLRNQIIHEGAPKYELKSWDNHIDAYKQVVECATWLEQVFLQILEYSGDANLYNTLIAYPETGENPE